MPRNQKRTLKVLALIVFLVALAMLIYSLPGNTSVKDIFPISSSLLIPPGGTP
jgi:hypothetical protein